MAHIPSVNDNALVQVVRLNGTASQTRWVPVSCVPRQTHDLWLPADPAHHVFVTESVQPSDAKTWNLELVPQGGRLRAIDQHGRAGWNFDVSDTAFDNAYDTMEARMLDTYVRAAFNVEEAPDGDDAVWARFLDNALLAVYAVACGDKANERNATTRPSNDEWVCCVIIVC